MLATESKSSNLCIQSMEEIINQRSLTDEMEKATKEEADPTGAGAVHKTKFLSTLSNNQVWIEVLFIFYEIFRFLEQAGDRLSHTYVTALYTDGMRRTKAFEEDLNFYLTGAWRENYRPRASVTSYLTYLRRLERDSPLLLMVYIYHLYTGLLTGGEMLEKSTRKAVPENGGFAIINFSPRGASRIKEELRAAMDKTAELLDEPTKAILIEESKVVFRMNNALIQRMQRSPQGYCMQLTGVVLILCFIGFITYIFHLTMMETLEDNMMP